MKGLDLDSAPQAGSLADAEKIPSFGMGIRVSGLGVQRSAFFIPPHLAWTGSRLGLRVCDRSGFELKKTCPKLPGSCEF